MRIFFQSSVWAILFLGCASTSVWAALSPLALSVIPPVQLPPSSFSVTGARLSALWGSHVEVFGFDIGAVGNSTEINFAGIAVSGVFNFNRGSSTIVGLQAAGIANINVNKARIFGLQFAAVINSNKAESLLMGLQVALVNLSPYTRIGGLQVGAYNKAGSVYGFQIGLVNVAKSLHGIQIGLINFNETGLFSVAPFLNVGF